MKGRLIAIAFLAIGYAHSAVATPVTQSLRYWTVDCDDARTCTASVAGYSNDNDAVTLKLTRSNAPDVAVEVTIEETIGMYQGIRVDMDAPGVFEKMGGVITSQDVVKSISFGQKPDDALLDGFRRVAEVIVRIAYGGEMGTVEYRVPMNGAVDAMMFMDIAQERVGRVDALLAKGPFPSDDPSDPYPYLNDEEEGETALASAVEEGGDAHMEEGPNGSYIDLLTELASIPDQVLMPGYRMFDCPGFEKAISDRGVLLNRDETARKTYVVPCKVGKANVLSYVVMDDPQNGLNHEVMEFQWPVFMNKPDRDAVLNPVWNAYDQTMTLTRFADTNLNCGAYEVHNWVPEARIFEIVEYREKNSCGGAKVQPEDFPLLWTIAEEGD